MAEYIEREALFEIVEQQGHVTVDDIIAIPAADVAPVVRGEWIKKSYLLGTSRFCSKCGENYGMPHGVFNYCPNCGARMRETLQKEAAP